MSPRVASLALFGLLVACRPPAGIEVGQPAPFLEKAYFSPLSPVPRDESLWFEGQPSAHFFLFNQYTNAEWQKGNMRGIRRWRVAWPISELFVVRMTDTISEPVLTPSYHIRPFYFQAVHLWRHKPWSPAYRLIGVATGATHYSNGQHGCTYRGFARNDTTRVCEIRDTALAVTRRTNTLDGDFSTTYIPLTVNFRLGELMSKAEPLKWQFTVGGEFQYHLFGGLPGAMNEEQAATYGRHQWSAHAELECRPRLTSGVWRVSADYTRRLGHDGGDSFGRGGVQVSRTWDAWHNAGVFVRFSSGYDYYNIRYQDRGNFVAAGVMWDLHRFDVLANEGPPSMSPPVEETQSVEGCFGQFWRRVPLAPSP